MIVDVAPPDLETRIAILQKMYRKNFSLPSNILPIVAATFQETSAN